MAGIPTLDARSTSFGEEFLLAYGTWGFGYLVNHGVAQPLIDEVFAQSHRFHALPLEEKLAIEVDGTHRGYIPFAVSTDVASSVEAVTKPNRSESLMMMRDLGPDHPDILAGTYLSGANKWPDLPGFREVMEEYQAVMSALGLRLMEVIADALGDDGRLLSSFDEPTTWLRLLHYPPQDPQSPADEYGSAPHTDFGAITLLAQDDVGGLSVKTPEGDWVDAPPLPGSFVLNVGDMLARWSNGRLRSTPHRVTNRTGRERYSVPFFFDPHVSTLIEPLPGLGEPTFEPLVFADFLRGQLEASYEVHKPKG